LRRCSVEYFEAGGGCYVTVYAGPKAERRDRSILDGFAVAQGALETNRRDYARLQRGLSAEQAVPQGSPQVDGASDTSKLREPSKARNGKGAGRGAKVMEAKPDQAAGEPTAQR
jgi:hypothetical protein